MPFDGHEMKVAPEISVLDEIIDTLKDPAHWCKYVYQSGDAVCLIGAIRLTEGLSPSPILFYEEHFLQKESVNIVNKMTALIKNNDFNTDRDYPYSIICEFNNSSTHEEVMDLLTKTRQSFMEG